MNIQYIRFNKEDKIIGAHKGFTAAFTKTRSDFNETYIDLNEYDLSSLCEPSELKKGNTIKGLWAFVDEIRIELYLNNLMVAYLRKEYVQSDETVRELADKGLKKHESLLDALALYNIKFDDWLEKYSESGLALKIKLEAEELAQAEKETLARAELKKANEHFAGACFSLPAIAGKMGSSIYYSVQIPFAQVPQLFKFNQEEVPVELRAQRILNEKRAYAIADYMEERKHDYTLPALTASVSESMRFDPVPGFSNLGMVQIPIGATMLINDGQHRASSIETILERCYHSFKDQSISVVLFYDQGLERSQQMFADINDKMVKPPKALNILFDRSNKMNSLVVESIEKVGIKQAVEFEKASPGAKSSKVWSISALKKAIETVTGLNDKKAKELDDAEFNDYKALIINWLNAVIEHSKPSLKQAVFEGTSALLSSTRTNLVVTHAAYLHSVALASQSMMKEFHEYQADPFVRELKGECPVPTFFDLNCLKDITDSKVNETWMRRIVNEDGTMNPTANGIKLGAHVILERMGVLIPAAIIEVNNLVFGEVA